MSLIKVDLGFVKLIIMIICKTSVIEVNCTWTQINSLVIVRQRLWPVFVLKLRQSQVVICRRFVILEFDCILQVTDGFVKSTGAPILDSTIELALILIISLSQVLEGLRVISDGIVDSIQSRHDKATIVPEGAGTIFIILNSKIIVTQSLVKLTKFKMLHTGIILKNRKLGLN